MFFFKEQIPEIDISLSLRMALFNYGTSKKALDCLTHIPFLLVCLFKESHKGENHSMAAMLMTDEKNKVKDIFFCIQLTL